MESKCTGCGRHNVFAVTADGDGMAFDFVHERDCLLRKLDAATTLLEKIGKVMNDPLLSQRQRIMIAEDIRQLLEQPK